MPGEHLVTYRDVGQCVQLARHFLAHEAERERIAQAGRRIVLTRHTYQHRMRAMLASLSRLPRCEPNSPVRAATDRAAPPLTSIILVTHNQAAYTRQCLDSIAAHTPQPHELIVVDNQSTDGTLAYLRSVADLRVIENDSNCGFPAAANQGINASRGQRILLLNNDVVVTPGWLERLSAALEHAPDIGMAGPVSNYVSGDQQVPVDYTDLGGLEAFARGWTHEHADQRTYVRRLVGFCLLIHRHVVERIGLLDERFGIGNFEDDDYCRRALAAGFRAVIARDAFVHHFGSVSFRGSGVNHAAILERNGRIFEKKWASSSAGALATPNHSVQPMSAQPGEQPLLSLCMIARNSARILAACLESVRAWVDEIIIVDTGSEDDTIKIAESFGARIGRFSWCDDFAAARNESLKLARGRWIFWIDSDDTMDSANGQKLRALVQRRHAAQIMGFILQVHCPTPPQAGSYYATTTAVDHVKVFRGGLGLQFSGRIHEQVLPAIRRLGGDVAWTDIYVTHSGPDLTPEGRARKHQRDLRILDLELHENPDDTFALFNMGMTLLDAERPAEALNYLCRSLQRASSGESHLGKLYALIVQAYTQLHRRPAALWTCEQGLRVCPGETELLFRKATLEQTLGNLQAAEASYRALLEVPRERRLSSMDQGILGIKCWHNLALLYQQQGDHAGAEAAWRRVLDFDKQNEVAWLGLIDAVTVGDGGARLERVGREADQPGVPTWVIAIVHARLLAGRGEHRAALMYLENAVGTANSLTLLRELCAFVLEHQFHDAARRWLTELIGLCPDDPAAHHNLAAVYLQTGNLPKAVDMARRSLELRPAYPETQRLLELAINTTPKPAANSSAAGGKLSRP